MNAPAPARATPPRAQKRAHGRFPWTILAWLGLASLAVILYRYRDATENDRIEGIVEIAMEPVAGLETARLLSVEVVEGQEVKAGQILAQLDTSLLDEEITSLTRELELEQRDRERQFSSAEDRLLADLRDLRLDKAKMEGELTILTAQLAQIEKRQPFGLSSPDDLETTRAAIAAARTQLELYPSLITDLETQIQSIRNTFQQTQSQDAVGGELALLRKQRDQLTLTAAHDGFVARIERMPGEIVEDGSPILQLVIHKPPQIHAFWPEDSLVHITPGVKLWITPRGLETPVIEASVAYISPHILSMPDRTSMLPRAVRRGRQVVAVPLDPTLRIGSPAGPAGAANPEGFPLIPGQAVTLHLRAPGASLLK